MGKLDPTINEAAAKRILIRCERAAKECRTGASIADDAIDDEEWYEAVTALADAQGRLTLLECMYEIVRWNSAHKVGDLYNLCRGCLVETEARLHEKCPHVAAELEATAD